MRLFSTSKGLDASRLEVLLHLRIPSSLPFLFAAARICFPLSIIGAVRVGVLHAGTANGLGSLIEEGFQENYLPPDLRRHFLPVVARPRLHLLVTLVERQVLSGARGGKSALMDRLCTLRGRHTLVGPASAGGTGSPRRSQ